jgi:hypothetical protein
MLVDRTAEEVVLDILRPLDAIGRLGQPSQLTASELEFQQLVMYCERRFLCGVESAVG